jgi:hypothetical protein
MAIFFQSMRQPSLSTDAMVGMSFALRKTEAHWRLICVPRTPRLSAPIVGMMIVAARGDAHEIDSRQKIRRDRRA